MITIPFTTEDLTKGARRVPPGTGLSALLAAICIERGCPYFLGPRPDASIATFGDELERLRATPSEVVHEEVETFVRAEKEQFGPLPAEKERLLEIYLNNPEGFLKRLVDALRRYYDLAIAPYWPRIQEHLEGDTIKRGQVLALGGVEAHLSGLHPKASYGGGVLELDKPYEAVVQPAGRGITLVPCVFVTPRVEVVVQPDYRPTLAYGPRRVANLWTSSSPTPNGTALEAALGSVRASVLKGVPVPTTTTELAHQTSPEPRGGLGPPLTAQGRRAGRAAPQRQEGLLPPQLRRRVAAQDLR